MSSFEPRRDSHAGAHAGGLYLGGCNSPFSQPIALSVFMGSGLSQTKHCHLRGPSPAGGNAKMRSAPHLGQVSRSACPMALSVAPDRPAVHSKGNSTQRILFPRLFMLGGGPLASHAPAAIDRHMTARKSRRQRDSCRRRFDRCRRCNQGRRNCPLQELCSQRAKQQCAEQYLSASVARARHRRSIATAGLDDPSRRKASRMLLTPRTLAEAPLSAFALLPELIVSL